VPVWTRHTQAYFQNEIALRLHSAETKLVFYIVGNMHPTKGKKKALCQSSNESD